MSDDRRKSTGLIPSSDSPSASSPSDPSLERLLGAIATALDGINRALEQQAKRGTSSTGHEARVEALLADLASRHEALTLTVQTSRGYGQGSLEQVSKLVAKAERAVEDSRKIVLEAKGPDDEITGQHIKLRWVTIAKYSAAYGPVALKVLGILGASAATAWGIAKNLLPLMHGW